MKLVTNRLAGDAVVVAAGLSLNVAARAKARARVAGNTERAVVVAAVVAAIEADLFHTVSTNPNSS